MKEASKTDIWKTSHEVITSYALSQHVADLLRCMWSAENEDRFDINTLVSRQLDLVSPAFSPGL